MMVLHFFIRLIDEQCIYNLTYCTFKNKSIVQSISCFLLPCLPQSCLIRNPRERVSIAELLAHPYLQLKPQASPEPGMYSHTFTLISICVLRSHLGCSTCDKPDLISPVSERPSNSDLQKILTDLAALQSPNSIIRAANVRFYFVETFSHSRGFININSAFFSSQNLAKMCSSGRKLDVAECAKSST